MCRLKILWWRTFCQNILTTPPSFLHTLGWNTIPNTWWVGVTSSLTTSLVLWFSATSWCAIGLTKPCYAPQVQQGLNSQAFTRISSCIYSHRGLCFRLREFLCVLLTCSGVIVPLGRTEALHGGRCDIWVLAAALEYSTCESHPLQVPCNPNPSINSAYLNFISNSFWSNFRIQDLPK